MIESKTTLLHVSHILGTYQMKSDPFQRWTISPFCNFKIIYVGFTGSYQAKYYMLPNLSQALGGNSYLISLDPNIMWFWFQFQLCPWGLYIWNLLPNQYKVHQLSIIWFYQRPSQILRFDLKCIKYYHFIHFDFF